MISIVTTVCAVQSRSLGSIPDTGRKLFCLTKRPGAAQLTGNPILVAQLMRNGTHYPPTSSAKVKNEWSYKSCPPYIITTCTRISLHIRKHERILIRSFLFWFVPLYCIVLYCIVLYWIQTKCYTHRKKRIYELNLKNTGRNLTTKKRRKCKRKAKT